MIDYSQVGNPLLLQQIFSPRKDVTPPPRGAFDLFVTVWERMERNLPTTSIIHGQQDRFVPVRDAIDLYEHLGSKEKELLIFSRTPDYDIMVLWV